MAMRAKSLAIFVAVALIGCAPALSAPNLASITIKSEHNVVKIGDDVKIEIILKNLSDRAIGLDLVNAAPDHAEFNYNIQMTTPEGKSASRTEYGTSILPDHDIVHNADGIYTFHISSYAFIDLNSKEELQGSVNLEKIFAISEPGSYLVNVSNKIRVAREIQNITSNTILLIIEK